MNMKLAVKLLRVLGGSLVSLGHNRRRHYKETHTAKKKKKKSSFFHDSITKILFMDVSVPI